jgi:hypothetical protein
MMMAPKMVAADGASRKRAAQMPQDGRDGVTATPSTNPGAGICNLQSNVPGGPGTTPWISAGFRIAEPSSRVDPFSGSRQHDLRLIEPDPQLLVGDGVPGMSAVFRNHTYLA